MENIRLAVIIPVYNSQATLERCLKSIINQEYENLEIIIVDDGSEDRSQEICRGFEQKDKRVKYVYKDNEGPSIARKFGIGLTDAEYITFADSDDYVDRKAYAFMMDTLAASKADIVQCGYKEITEPNHGEKIFELKESTLEGNEKCAEFFAKQENTTNYLCNKIFRARLFKGIIFPPLYASEDRCILTQLYSTAEKVVNIPQPFYNYVMTPESLCRKPITTKRKLDKIEAAKFIIDFYEEKHPELAVYGVDMMCSFACRLYVQMQSSSIKDKLEVLEYIGNVYDAYYDKLKLFDKKIGTRQHRALLKLFRMSKILGTRVYGFRNRGESSRGLSFLQQYKWRMRLCGYKIYRCIINPVQFKCYRIFKGYKVLELNDDIRNGVYKVLIKGVKDQKYVLKIPRKDNYYSRRFVKAIAKKEDYIEFRDMLLSLGKLKYLGNHINPVTRVYRSGAYEGHFIEGYNLKELYNDGKKGFDNKGMDSIFAKELVNSIDLLRRNLHSHVQECGDLTGDWAIHNLMYDLSTEQVLNVDSEGFYMYQDGEDECQLEHITEQLLFLRQLIEENFSI